MRHTSGMKNRIMQSVDKLLEECERIAWEILGEQAQPFIAATLSNLRRRFSLLQTERERKRLWQQVERPLPYATQHAARLMRDTGDVAAARRVFEQVLTPQWEAWNPPLDYWFPDYEQVAAIWASQECSLEDAIRFYAQLKGESYQAVRRRVWRTLRTLSTLPLREVLREMLEDDDGNPPCALVTDHRGRTYVVTPAVIELIFAYTRGSAR